MLSLDFIPNSGGIAAHVYELSKNLVKNGNSITVLTINRWNNNFTYKKSIEGINVISFLRNIEFFGKIFSGLILLFLVLYHLIINKKKYDLIHWHGFKGIEFVVMVILKFVFGVKNVWTNHTSHYIQAYNKKKFSELNRLLIIPDWIIAPSRELAIKSAKNVNFEEKRVSYVFNGVDVNKFKPKGKNKNLLNDFNLNEETKIIISTRRFETKNGLRYLVKAIPKVIKVFPESRFIFIGDFEGPIELSDKNYIINYVKKYQLNNNVIFTGNILNENLVEYYSIADLTVLPSLIEAVSISGLESIACGVPIVGSNVGGISEIIQNGKNGFLTEPGNSNDIANKIINLLKSSDLFQMKINARDIAVNKFCWKNISYEVENVYEKVFC
jgi:glycosyltransferase involved in cell wall biosynthesis